MPVSGEIMLVRPMYQQRIDTAARVVEIDNGPTLTYVQSYGATRTIRWVVERVALQWEVGVLYLCHVSGHRRRKDGSVGLIADFHNFPVEDGIVRPPDRRDYPVRWLQWIVSAYGLDMPESTMRTPPEERTIIREP